MLEDDVQDLVLEHGHALVARQCAEDFGVYAKLDGVVGEGDGRGAYDRPDA